MAFSSKAWYAATSSGLLASIDRGVNWTRKPIGPFPSLPAQSVRMSADGERIRIVSQRGLVFSEDGGASWTWHDLPLNSGGALTLQAQPGDENTLIATARAGLYISRDAGKTWQQAASGLPATPVQDFAATGGVYVASMRTGGLYISSDSGPNLGPRFRHAGRRIFCRRGPLRRSQGDLRGVHNRGALQGGMAGKDGSRRRRSREPITYEPGRKKTLRRNRARGGSILLIFRNTSGSIRPAIFATVASSKRRPAPARGSSHLLRRSGDEFYAFSHASSHAAELRPRPRFG